MTVNDIVSKMSNGAAYVTLVDYETGEIILKTIWYNSIPVEHLDREIVHINVTDYTITLIVKYERCEVGNI